MALKRIITQDKNIQLIQDNVDSALTPLQNGTFTNGQLLKNLSLISGQDNLISHNLGYVPTIILSLMPNMQSTIWSPNSTSLNGSNANSSQINLRCSASCVASIWVK